MPPGRILHVCIHFEPRHRLHEETKTSARGVYGPPRGGEPETIHAYGSERCLEPKVRGEKGKTNPIFATSVVFSATSDTVQELFASAPCFVLPSESRR